MNKWFNVEEKLPKFEEEVICYWSECDGGMSIGTLDEVRYIHTKNGVETHRDWTLYSSVGIVEYDVTHWMEIPKKPTDYKIASN